MEMSWNLLCRPGWPQTQRSACLCLCLLRAGLKGMCPTQPEQSLLTQSPHPKLSHRQGKCRMWIPKVPCFICKPHQDGGQSWKLLAEAARCLWIRTGLPYFSLMMLDSPLYAVNMFYCHWLIKKLLWPMAGQNTARRDAERLPVSHVAE